MNRKLTQEAAEEKVQAALQKKNLTLVEPYIYTGASSTVIKVQCHKKHDPYPVRYNGLVNTKSSCPTCAKGCISRHLFVTRTMKKKWWFPLEP